MDTPWPAVRDAIRRRREALGLTQREAADIAGISPDRWRVFENAEEAQNPRAPTARGIAEALEWKPDALRRIADGADPADVELGEGEAGPSVKRSFATRLKDVERRLAGLESELREILSELRGE